MLAIWGRNTYATYASLTDFDGRNSALQWTYDANATAYGLCSFTLEGEIYFIGQVSSKESLVFFENI